MAQGHGEHRPRPTHAAHRCRDVFGALRSLFQRTHGAGPDVPALEQARVVGARDAFNALDHNLGGSVAVLDADPAAPALAARDAHPPNAGAKLKSRLPCGGQSPTLSFGHDGTPLLSSSKTPCGLPASWGFFYPVSGLRVNARGVVDLATVVKQTGKLDRVDGHACRVGAKAKRDVLAVPFSAADVLHERGEEPAPVHVANLPYASGDLLRRLLVNR